MSSDLDTIQETLSQHKDEIKRRFPVKSLAVFGSYARQADGEDSDVDVMVEFDRQVGIEFIDLADYLEDLLKIRIDLVSRRALKPRYFESIKDELRYV